MVMGSVARSLGTKHLLPSMNTPPGMCDYEEDMEEWLRWWRTRASVDSLKESLEELPKVIPSPLETPEPAYRRRLALRH